MAKHDGEYIFINMAATYPDSRRITVAEGDRFHDDLIAFVVARGMQIGGTLWVGDDEEADDGTNDPRAMGRSQYP